MHIYYARLRHFIVAEGRRRRRRSTRRRRRRRSTRRRRRRRRRKIRRRRRKKKKKNTKSRCFTSRIAYEKLCYIAMLYTYLIGNQPYNTMVVFIMRDSAPSTRYSSVSKRRSLTLPYSIKSDLSLEERKRESALLKERWSLIQSGIECKFIRIHNLSIFVNNKLHGKLDLSSNQFHCCSPLNTPLYPNSPLVTNSTSPNNVSSPTTSVITNSTAPSIVSPPTTSNPVVPNLQSVPSIPDNVATNPLSACSSPSVPHIASPSHSPSN